MNETSTTPTISTGKTKKKGSAFTTLLLILVLALVAGLSATGFLYWQTRQELNRMSQPGAQEELAKREISAVVQRLSKLTILPDEEPVVATIIDAEFLATQSAFYQSAANGDKLVVYPEAQKAYIYSPSRNILVNAGPLILDSEAEQTGADTELEADPEPTPVAPAPSPVTPAVDEEETP